MKLCLHGLVYLGWIMDYVPFLIFLLYLYIYLWCDKKRFWTLNVFSNFRKISIYVKLSKNPDFGQNFRKIAIFVKIEENFKFVKIFDTSQFYSKHLDFGPNFQKSRFWSKLLKKSWLKSKFSKYLDFSQKNSDFGQNLWKSWYWSKFSKNPEFGQIFEKILLMSMNIRKSRFWSYFTKNRDFGQNLWNSWFWKRFLKYLDFGENSQFWTKVSKIAILVKIGKNFQLGQNLR